MPGECSSLPIMTSRVGSGANAEGARAHARPRALPSGAATQRARPPPRVSSEIAPRFPCGFGHLDSYCAIYYTYTWSLAIPKEQAGVMDAGVARDYRWAVPEPGGAAPAARMVERFLGRPLRFDAYETWLNEGQ